MQRSPLTAENRRRSYVRDTASLSPAGANGNSSKMRRAAGATPNSSRVVAVNVSPNVPDGSNTRKVNSKEKTKPKMPWDDPSGMALKEEFKAFHLPIYIRQWVIMARLGAVLAVFFAMYAMLSYTETDKDEVKNPCPLYYNTDKEETHEEHAAELERDKIATIALSAVMFLASMAEIGFSMTKIYRKKNYAFLAHLAMLTVYGACLAAMEFFSLVSNSPR